MLAALARACLLAVPREARDPGWVGAFSFAEPFRGSSATAAAPLWSAWNGEFNERYTLGVEEEVMLLNPLDWTLAQVSDQVLVRLSEPLSHHISPETHAGVVELVSGVHPNVARAVRELSSLRRRLADELYPLSLAVAAAGMHPFTVWEDTELSRRLATD